MKKAILVLGAPRSGTSVVSHIIHKLGADFGSHDRFVDSQVHTFNPIFFELQSLNNLNDEIFAYFSKKFINFDWVPNEEDFGNEVIAKFEKKITKFIDDEFSKNNTIGLKDTRFCFTLPIWDVILKRLGFDVHYVLTQRSANAVFVSNKLVNKCSPATNFSIVVQSTLLARHFITGRKHVIVRYEDLLADPGPSIMRLCDDLSMDRALIGKARSVIREDLNHHKKKADFFLYNYFEKVIDSESVSPDEYLWYREIFLASTFEKEQIIANLSQTLAELNGQIANPDFSKLIATNVSLKHALGERDEQIVNLRHALGERGDEQDTYLRHTLDERDEQVTNFRHTLDERDEQIVNLRHILDERDEQIVNLRHILDERDEQVVNLRHTLDERDEQVVNLRQTLGKRDEQIVNLNKDMSKLDASNANLNNALDERNEQINFLNEVIDQRDVQIDALNHVKSVLNVELLNLNTERARGGARIGRVITRLCGRIAPVGTSRGSVVELIMQFFSSLAISGLKITAAKTYHYVTFSLRSKFFRNRIAKDAMRDVPIEGNSTIANIPLAKIQTDHPQLKAWIHSNEPSQDEITAQKTLISKYHYTPLISVIVPIYKVPQDVLEETLASLEQQSYSNWQACIVWSSIDDTVGWDWLQTRCNKDKRFRIKLLSENGGISNNSDSAFELVDGEYIALLDHDDTLTPWAFFEIVKLLQTSPELDFIYSDKDSISADGMIRLNALFKPEWSPEMLHSVNYLTHLNVIRTSLVKEVGGWRSETDGAQDWDLFFRITEKTQNIARVPSIHYHWRILPTSTATGLAVKPYAALGQLKSQQDYFKRRGLAATVMPSPEGMFHVCWPIRTESTDIIIFQNGSLSQLVTTLNVLRAVKQESIRHIHVIHSTPATDLLYAFNVVWQDRIFFKQIEMADWLTGLEITLSVDTAETILLLEGNATGFSETIVDELSGWVAQHPDIAWASAIALNLNGTSVYEAGRVVSADNQSAPMFCNTPLFSFGWFGGPLWYRNSSACSPYAVSMKSCDVRSALSKLNTLTGAREKFITLCLELSANGRRGLIDPFARVHFDISPEKNWPNDGIPYHVDPYFNPAFDQVSPLRLKS